MTTFKVVKVSTFKSFSLNLNGRLWKADQPVIVGILNASKDSFYSGQSSVNEAMAQAESLIKDGADWLDIGACSTQPGAEIPGIDEAWSRLKDLLPAMRKTFPGIPMSIDSFRPEIVRRANEEGVDMINDISGGCDTMFQLAADRHMPYVLSHFPEGKTPSDMQDGSLPSRDAIIPLVMKHFTKQLLALQAAGVKDVMLDPGFGFGKDNAGNFGLLEGLPLIAELQLPLYVGLSRKSMLWKNLGGQPKDMLAATSAIHAVALQRGASILRVHDPKEAKQVVTLLSLLAD
jgi:dihydropteroate synthase